MKMFTLLVLACVCVSSMLGVQDAAARGRKAGVVPAIAFASTSANAPASKPRRAHKAAGSSGKAQKQPPAAKPNAPKSRHVVAKASARDIAVARQAVASELSERGARADRLYAASRFSAPIILNAKACRRTASNGESIYENC